VRKQITLLAVDTARFFHFSKQVVVNLLAIAIVNAEG